MYELVGIGAALFSTFCWALGTIHLKKLTEKLSPIAMTIMKSLYGGLILLIIALIAKEKVLIDSNYLSTIIYSGIVGIAIGDTLFFSSLKYLSPIVLSIILLAGPDIFTGILAFIFLKEIPPLLVWIGIFLVLFGLYYLIFPIEVEETNKKSCVKGYIFALLSLFCTAIAMVIIKPVLNYVPTITVTAYRLLFGGIVLFLFSIFNKELYSYSIVLKDKSIRNTFLSTISLIAVGGFWLSILSIKYIDLITASTLMALEPLFITIIMVIFYQYKPKKRELLGFLLSILGILIISFGELGIWTLMS